MGSLHGEQHKSFHSNLLLLCGQEKKIEVMLFTEKKILKPSEQHVMWQYSTQEGNYVKHLLTN